MSVPLDFPLALQRVQRTEVRVPRPRTGPPPQSVASLLDQARHDLAQAEREDAPAERFAQAHLSALRGAAAVLALRGRPHRGRYRPTSVWTLLPTLAPELGEWAAFFAAGSATRAAILAGITGTVGRRDADDLVRQVGQFLDLVTELVGRAGR